MVLPSYKKISSLATITDVQQEFLLQQRNLAELKVNNFLRTAIRGTAPGSFKFVLKQPHLKKHTKRRIAQLKYQEHMLKEASFSK